MAAAPQRTQLDLGGCRGRPYQHDHGQRQGRAAMRRLDGEATVDGGRRNRMLGETLQDPGGRRSESELGGPAHARDRALVIDALLMKTEAQHVVGHQPGPGSAQDGGQGRLAHPRVPRQGDGAAPGLDRAGMQGAVAVQAEENGEHQPGHQDAHETVVGRGVRPALDDRQAGVDEEVAYSRHPQGDTRPGAAGHVPVPVADGAGGQDLARRRMGGHGPDRAPSDVDVPFVVGCREADQHGGRAHPEAVQPVHPGGPGVGWRSGDWCGRWNRSVHGVST